MSSNSWRDLINYHIVYRREDGNQTLKTIVDRQNIKVACLELFNEKNLEFNDIDKCVNKLYQSSLIMKDVYNKITKFCMNLFSPNI